MRKRFLIKDTQVLHVCPIYQPQSWYGYNLLSTVLSLKCYDKILINFTKLSAKDTPNHQTHHANFVMTLHQNTSVQLPGLMHDEGYSRSNNGATDRYRKHVKAI